MLVIANLALCAALVVVGVMNVRRCANDSDRLFLLGCLAAVCAFAAVLMTHVPSPGTCHGGSVRRCPGRSACTLVGHRQEGPGTED